MALLQARIYGRNLSAKIDKDFLPNDVFGLAYAPHKKIYFHGNGNIDALPDSAECIYVVSGPYAQWSNLPKGVWICKPLSYAASSAMMRSILAVGLGRGGLEVRILDAHMQSTPKLISVATEQDGEKQFITMACQYDDAMQINKSMEPLLAMRLPACTTLSNGDFRLEGSSLRLILARRKHNLSYVLENRTELANRLKFVVGTPEEVAYFERAMAGDESVLSAQSKS